MTEHPIIFSAPMVRAILAGSKTQTRRAIKRPLQHPGWTEYCYFGPSKNDPSCRSMAIECGPDYPDGDSDQVKCPYGAAGDRLWVRETWHQEGGQSLVRYRASGDDLHALKRWKSSMFMPRSASRITLEVTNVYVGRLHELSEGDAAAEGVLYAQGEFENNRDAYRALWDSINGKKAPWASNPWVWVLTFRRIGQ